MARTLDYTISALYGLNTQNRCWGGYRNRDSFVRNMTVKYAEIPISGDSFEIPVFAIPAFAAAIKESNNVDVIAVRLNTLDYEAGYKGVERNLIDILIEKYDDSSLVRLETKQGEETITYYGTHGAIFNYNFTPLAVFYWLIDKINVEGVTKYKFVKPILRIDRSVFIYRGDSVERFITNKMLNTSLEEAVYSPYQWAVNDCFIESREDHQVKVEIDGHLLQIRDIDHPSISTTNKDLLKLAIDHIDEVIR